TDTAVMMGDNQDYKYYGNSTKFAGLRLNFSTPGSGYNVTAEYSKGGGVWGSVTITDNTTNFTTNGNIYFAPPTDWATDTVSSTPGVYWIRFKTSTNPTVTAVSSVNYILP